MAIPSNNLLALVLASLIGGGGVGVVLPKVAPGWYRDDPAYGVQLRALQHQVQAMQRQFHEFLLEGPREVRENQTRILAKLEAIETRLDRVDRDRQ